MLAKWGPTSSALLLYLLLATSASADIYRHIDKHGRVILTDRPQSNQYVKLVKTWKGWQPRSAVSYTYQNLRHNRLRHTPAINAIAKRYKLSESLIHAVITAESAYDADAVSRAGAVGLMQLMPATAQRYGVKNRRDPYQNITAGVRYLRDLLKLFDNDLKLALAAYNAGEGTVKKYNNQIPPYRETRNYVAKVLNFYHSYKK